MKKLTSFVFALFAAMLTQAHGQAGQIIPAPEAIAQALAMTGGGSVTNLKLVQRDDAQVYEITIVHGQVRFSVTVNASSGKVIGITGDTTVSSAPEAARPMPERPRPIRRGPMMPPSAARQPNAVFPAP